MTKNHNYWWFFERNAL